VAAYAAHAYGASLFHRNDTDLSCFLRATAAASWAYLDGRQGHAAFEAACPGCDDGTAAVGEWGSGHEMAEGGGVDAVDVMRSCDGKETYCCVSEAGTAVLATVFGLPAMMLVATRGPAVQCVCGVQLCVFILQASGKTDMLDLDTSLNL
jgi:hypothetical protein